MGQPGVNAQENLARIRALMEPLSIADPETAELVRGLLLSKTRLERIPRLAEYGIKALASETAFGKAYCLGMARILDEPDRRFNLYCNLVNHAGREGATLGKLVAESMPLAILSGKKNMGARLIGAIYSVKKWSTHAMERPLEAFSWLMHRDDPDSAAAYLHLVRVVFHQSMTYHQRLLFSQLLPKAAKNLPKARRCFQMQALAKVGKVSLDCIEPLCDGLEKGVHLLDKEALEIFTDEGLGRLSHSRDAAMKFLRLESKLGADSFSSLQVTVSLESNRQVITRYLRARTGKGLNVKPIEPLHNRGVGRHTLSITDGRAVYLPGEMGFFPDKENNTALYKALARLEAGLCEFETYDFDLTKAVFACRARGLEFSLPETQSQYSDLFLFLFEFDAFQIARDLFVALEHARVGRLLLEKYPGFAKSAFPYMIAEMERILEQGAPPMTWLYASAALGMDMEKFHLDDDVARIIQTSLNAFQSMEGDPPDVHQSAALTADLYGPWLGFLQSWYGVMMAKDLVTEYQPMQVPFGRTILAGGNAPMSENDRRAAQLMAKLSQMGVYALRSDLKKRMDSQHGTLTEQDLRDLIMQPPEQGATEPQPLEPEQEERMDFSSLRDSGDLAHSLPQDDDLNAPVFWYKEWDHNSQDYLPDYCRVVAASGLPSHGEFYDASLKEHSGLVKNIRKSFELLRPQGLAILRHWVEGDDFDYRALIDYAVDRRMGRTPSERLYIKRVKQIRDVSVLLLVDLSRSTSNLAAGSEKSVLDVEKEAIVLFCEALGAVGDSFAIAGFSGAGRLRVDYTRIKDFEEAMTPEVKQRISGMAPSRNTRMGPAIRHAAHVLSQVPSKVRLMIVLSDGFPNDLEYKGQYSIADTRKAIAEARSQQVHVHAITVNLQTSINLDLIYGGVHHNLISDVRELPHKLPRIYRTLTR
ncbi:von Willebrand factor type A [Desulfatibacillum aliphaticivorans]|uniref:von Willebrand factor type A n=1 Tax=Desulfatibacillum aliphaticivorans TaxID=218208 RepID=B8FEP0_DESAL|nr:VWA domain-containing protein [Desulfatibacillum aliphaticivorans]ACL03567.1 von Willebrand factor type A [Desulfatibacillum aliphaticivorans]